MNRLTISGNEALLQDFYYRAWGYNSSLPLGSFDNDFIALQFENFIPVAEFNRLHNTQVWGCDGRIDIQTVERSFNRLFYEFQTAWQPPIEFIQAVALQYPKLHFMLQWGEPGEGFAGVLSGEGEDLGIEHHNYGPDDAVFWGMEPDEDWND